MFSYYLRVEGSQFKKLKINFLHHLILKNIKRSDEHLNDKNEDLVAPKNLIISSKNPIQDAVELPSKNTSKNRSPSSEALVSDTGQEDPGSQIDLK